MPASKLFTRDSYEVYEDGTIVVLRVGNSGIRFTWDAAIRISAKLRVFLRDAQEYIGMSRQLEDPDPARDASRKHVMRNTPVVMEGDYSVYTKGADTILKVRNGELAMAPDMARNISDWFHDSGQRIQHKYFPDMTLNVAVANLTDGELQDRIRQGRRDATAKFG